VDINIAERAIGPQFLMNALPVDYGRGHNVMPLSGRGGARATLDRK
jgi:hypothetical protein